MNSNLRFIKKMAIFLLLVLTQKSFGLAPSSHFKQLSDDEHTYILYSFRCATDNKKNCSLQALAVSDEKAKNSCYVVYQTIFKNKPLKQTKGKDFIQVLRNKCGDVATYTFFNDRIISQFKNLKTNEVSVSDERCEIFKASKNEAKFLSSEPIIPQIGFSGCKTFTFRMDD